MPKKLFSKENPGPSRKGKPNKITRTVREAFEQVFLSLQENGGKSSLVQWADKNPAAFYQLAARLIPAEMNLGLTTGALAERLIAARRRVVEQPAPDADDLA
jgi:hypothetical protein